jgi:hypothetical protein
MHDIRRQPSSLKTLLAAIAVILVGWILIPATSNLATASYSYGESPVYELQSKDGISIQSVSTPVCGIRTGQEYVAAVAFENRNQQSIPNVFFITQDIDSAGVVESIIISEKLAVPNSEAAQFGNNWQPMTSGKHTLEGFIWQIDPETAIPYPLIEKMSTVVDVVEKC